MAGTAGYSEKNQRIFVFLTGYMLYVLSRVVMYYLPDELQNTIQFYASGMFFACTFFAGVPLLNRNMHHNKAVYVLVGGAFSWLAWMFFLHISGLALPTSLGYLRNGLSFTVFFTNLMLAAKIVIVYNLKKQLLRISLAILGTVLIVSYVLNFDGFAFLGHLSGLFHPDARYITTYGMPRNHNTLGYVCFQYVILHAIYHAVMQSPPPPPAKLRISKIDRLSSAYFRILLPVVWIILISSASRAAITGVLGFWLVYLTASHYQNVSKQIKVLFVLAVAIVLAAIIILVDWAYIWELSLRASNYTVLGYLTKHNAWLTGLGFIERDHVISILDTAAFDGI